MRQKPSGASRNGTSSVVPSTVVRRSGVGASTHWRGLNVTSREHALVRAQRDLVFGAAVDVVEDDRRQAALRHSPKVRDIDDL